MKSVLLNTTVIGSSVKLPRHPKLILGEPGKYVHGDILDANAVTSEIDSKIAALINNAPSALDTLKEIADALGNDADLAGTLLNEIDQLDGKIEALTVNTDSALEQAMATLRSEVHTIENTLQLKDNELEGRVSTLENTLTWKNT